MTLGLQFTVMFQMLVISPLYYNSEQLIFVKQLTFDSQVFFSAGFPTIQAIAFCCLHRKSTPDDSEDPTLDPNFNLAIAPDLVDFWKIRSVQKTIEYNIQKIWKTDLDGTQDLTYLIGATQSGEIVACIPQTQLAIDRIHETPLPSLVQASDLEESAEVFHQPIAKFNLTFSPPVTAKLQSCRGIPLWLLVLAIVTGSLVLSVLVAQLRIP